MSIASRIADHKAKKSQAGKGKPVSTMVRISPALHETLKNLAYEHHISLNQLCVLALENCRDELFGKAPGEAAKVAGEAQG